MSYDATYLETANDHCSGNELEVQASKIAFCISCSKSFDPSLVHETSHQYGDNSGYQVVESMFGSAMNEKYFDEPLGIELAWKELKQCFK